MVENFKKKDSKKKEKKTTLHLFEYVVIVR